RAWLALHTAAGITHDSTPPPGDWHLQAWLTLWQATVRRLERQHWQNYARCPVRHGRRPFVRGDWGHQNTRATLRCRGPPHPDRGRSTCPRGGVAGCGAAPDLGRLRWWLPVLHCVGATWSAESPSELSGSPTGPATISRRPCSSAFFTPAFRL